MAVLQKSFQKDLRVTTLGFKDGFQEGLNR